MLFSLKKKSLYAAILGNLVEYYDYALYGFLATEISHHFFPSSNPSMELLQAFAVFALGSIAKPLGALVFSKIGDRRGRKSALRWNMIGIALPTAAIGLIPGYESWGIFSPLLLISCRLFQGFFLGGESDGVRIYIMEHVGPKRYCFANGLSGLTSYFGIYIASYLSSTILDPGFTAITWQSLFIVGGLLGATMIILRRHINETPEFLDTKKNSAPLKTTLEILKKNKRLFIATLILTGTSGGLYHFIIIFMNSYLSDILAIVSPAQAARYTSYGLLAYTISSVLGGYVGDYMPKIKMVMLGKMSVFIAATFLCYQINEGEVSLFCFPLLGTLLGFFSTPIFPMLIERIPINERYRTIGLAHPIGSMIFSGTTPVVATYLFQLTHHPVMPILYFLGLILLNLISLVCLNRRAHDLPS